MAMHGSVPKIAVGGAVERGSGTHIAGDLDSGANRLIYAVALVPQQ